MPHYLNFDQMRESAFVLQHLCFGSRQFREKYAARGEHQTSESECWEYYAGMLKSHVSEVLIQNATRTRIIQDTLRNFEHDEQDPFDIDDIGREAISGLVIAHDMADRTPLSLRAVSNKIIHATDTRLEWTEDSEGDRGYWTGNIQLSGSYQGEDWKVEVYAEIYAQALVRWLDLLDSKVDWRLLYKYDE